MLINLLVQRRQVHAARRRGAHRAPARDARGIEIAVADSGVGISARDLERLGKPFEQVEGEHVRSKEGTGLGLALVKAFAAMHGGEAMIESVLGEGTTVRVRLPFAAVDEKGERAAPEKPRSSPSRARRRSLVSR